MSLAGKDKYIYFNVYYSTEHKDTIRQFIVIKNLS